jgi:hypothetical protein
LKNITHSSKKLRANKNKEGKLKFANAVDLKGENFADTLFSIKTRHTTTFMYITIPMVVVDISIRDRRAVDRTDHLVTWHFI